MSALGTRQGGRRAQRCGVCFWQGRFAVISGCVWPQASVQHHEDQELIRGSRDYVVSERTDSYNPSTSLSTYVSCVFHPCGVHTVLVHRGIGRLPATPAPSPGLGPGEHMGSVVSSGTPVGRITPLNSFWVVPSNHLVPRFVLLKCVSLLEKDGKSQNDSDRSWIPLCFPLSHLLLPFLLQSLSSLSRVF